MQEPLRPETVYHVYNHANGSENLPDLSTLVRQI